MRGSPHVSVMLLISLLAGCPRCNKAAPSGARTPSIHRFLPRVAEAVVVIPKLDRLGEKLRQLERLKLASFLAQLEGFPSAEAYVSAVMEQLGVELRSADELARAGIDGGRAAAIAFVSARRRYLVIALADAPRFQQTVRRLAANRLGATVETTREELGRAVTYFARPGEAGAVLAFVPVESFVLLAAEDSVEELAGYAALSLPESLADVQPLATALGHLPPSPDVYLHVPTTSNLAGQGTLANCTVSAGLSAQALQVRARLPRGPSAQWPSLLRERPAEDFIASLAGDAFLVARFSGDPLVLAKVWPTLAGPQLAGAIERSGIALEQGVFDNIEPGTEASISLAPSASFAEMPSLNIRRTSPFRYFHLVALVPVKDPRKADQTLEKLPALAAQLGATVQRTDRLGHKVFLSSYAPGEGVHFAEVNGKVAVASPVERLDQTIARLSEPARERAGPIADPELRRALSARPLTAVLDLPALANSIRGMPSSAWGVGGFAIKAGTVRWLDALDDVRAITGGAYLDDDAVAVEIDLRFVKR